MFKTMALIICLTVSGWAYAACRSVIIETPSGYQVCFICNDGKFINCQPL